MFDVPLPSLLREWLFFSSFFFVGNVGSLETQIYILKKKIWRKKRKKAKTPFFVKGSAGVHETRVQNFRVYLSKTAWTLNSEGIWGFIIEPSYTQVEGEKVRLVVFASRTAVPVCIILLVIMKPLLTHKKTALRRSCFAVR